MVMGPELVLAIDACATESSSLIVDLVSKLNQIRKLKRKCRALGNDAVLMNQVLQKNKNAIDSLSTVERYRTCLKKIMDFVNLSQSLGLAGRTLEVLFRHDYTRLRSEVREICRLFIFESVPEILTKQGAGFEGIERKLGRITEEQRTQGQILVAMSKDRAKGLQEQRQIFGSRPLNHLDCDFVLSNDMPINFDAGMTTGTCLFEGARFICRQLELNTSTKRYLDEYRAIQAGAFVEHFVGTLSANGKYYAVLEDLAGQASLASLSGSHALPKDPHVRLQLAYDIAKSMAWFHKAEILMKSISDFNIIIRQTTRGNYYPTIKGLENSRQFLERTSSMTCDIRYEACEYQVLREHSSYTDIWALGVVIWQCIYGASPYKESEEILDDKSPIARVIRQRLVSSDSSTIHSALFWLGDNNKELQEICQQCCDTEPLLRPTAAHVAQKLQEIMFRRQCHSSTLQESNDDNSTSIDSQGCHGDSEDDLSEVLSMQLRTSRDFSYELILHIRKAREANRNAQEFVQYSPQPKVDPAQFKLFISGDEGNPLKNFILGACLWWQLVEGCPTPAARVPGEHDLTLTALDGDSVDDRANEALFYLHQAVSSGYTEAYFEIYKIHRILSNHHQSRFIDHRRRHRLIRKE